jgi:hypothetical protein
MSNINIRLRAPQWMEPLFMEECMAFDPGLGMNDKRVSWSIKCPVEATGMDTMMLRLLSVAFKYSLPVSFNWEYEEKKEGYQLEDAQYIMTNFMSAFPSFGFEKEGGQQNKLFWAFNPNEWYTKKTGGDQQALSAWADGLQLQQWRRYVIDNPTFEYEPIDLGEVGLRGPDDLLKHRDSFGCHMMQLWLAHEKHSFEMREWHTLSERLMRLGIDLTQKNSSGNHLLHSVAVNAKSKQEIIELWWMGVKLGLSLEDTNQQKRTPVDLLKQGWFATHWGMTESEDPMESIIGAYESYALKQQMNTALVDKKRKTL